MRPALQRGRQQRGVGAKRDGHASGQRGMRLQGCGGRGGRAAAAIRGCVVRSDAARAAQPALAPFHRQTSHDANPSRTGSDGNPGDRGAPCFPRPGDTRRGNNKSTPGRPAPAAGAAAAIQP